MLHTIIDWSAMTVNRTCTVLHVVYGETYVGGRPTGRTVC